MGSTSFVSLGNRSSNETKNDDKNLISVAVETGSSRGFGTAIAKFAKNLSLYSARIHLVYAF
jgi:hypothetical protein